MKHIKNFENTRYDFKFAVNIKNITVEDVYKLIDKIKYEFNDSYDNLNFDFTKLIHQIKDPLQRFNKPWALVFSIHLSILFNTCDVEISQVVTQGWGAGYEYMENIITLDELFNRSFIEIKNYIEIKKNVDKYNL